MRLRRALPVALCLLLAATSVAVAVDPAVLSPCEEAPAGADLEDSAAAFAPEEIAAILTAPDAEPDPAEGSAARPPEPQSLKEYGNLALQDTIGILGAPLHWTVKNWLVFGGIAAGVVAVGYAFDYPMRNKTQAHQTHTLDDLTKVVEPFGAGYSWAVIGAYGIAGFVFRAPDAKNIFFDSIMASILASGIITPTLKFVIGR